MRTNFKKVVVLAMIYFMANISYADTNIYPLPAIFTAKNINNKNFETLKNKDKNFFINTFINTFNKNFDNSTTEINDKNKYNTFVAYINIPRVSENKLYKDNLIDIYMPMTASLNFINIATSELLYSESLTKYAKYKTTKEVLEENTSNNIFEKLYKETYENINNELIDKAKNSFKPYSIDANIVDKYKNLYVLNAGTTKGIAKGDLLTDKDNNQLSVLYSDLDYAVATLLIGKANKENVYSKYSTSSIMQLKKPKVLFINDFYNEKIYNLFASAIGNNADFSLITTDKTFYDMQTALVSLNNNFSISNTQKREIPDYFFKLNFTPPLFAIYPTNKSFFNIHRYGMFVCGHIIDNQGNVVYASCVNDEISDEVVSDIKFSDEAQYEIVTKNAFSKMASDIATNVKFKSATIEIDKVKDNTIELTDNNNLLNIGNDVTVMKKVKTDELDSDVIIPTWTYKVIDIKENTIICEKVNSLIDDLPNPSRRDFIKINAITKSKTRTNSYDFVIGNSEINGNEVALKYFDIVAFNTISSKLNLPISVNKTILAEQINDLNNGYGFKRKISIPTQKSKNFINVKYKANLLEEKKKGNLIEQTYEIICGLIISNGNTEDEKKIGLKQEVTFRIPPTKDLNIIEYELLIKLKELIIKIAEDFNSL